MIATTCACMNANLGCWHEVRERELRLLSWQSWDQSADMPGSSQPETHRDSSARSPAICTKTSAAAHTGDCHIINL